ncbi:MAG TPA: hypothetical protein VFC69_09235 [Dysgonamonadaceae bacterium]|nr:hypothetical protein [Dysgonamonadaceae bacterium]
MLSIGFKTTETLLGFDRISIMYPTNTPIEPERNLLLLIIRLVIIKSTYLVLIGANEMSGILLVWQIYKTPLYITLKFAEHIFFFVESINDKKNTQPYIYYM